MSKIREAKKAFSEAFDAELDELLRDLTDIASRVREAGNDSQGLNKLAQGFNGIATTVETAIRQADELRNEQRAWLGVAKPQITEHVSQTALGPDGGGKEVHA